MDSGSSGFGVIVTGVCNASLRCCVNLVSRVKEVFGSQPTDEARLASLTEAQSYIDQAAGAIEYSAQGKSYAPDAHNLARYLRLL